MFGLLQAVENYRSPFESLRANGGAVEMIEYFPFVLSFVEALLSFSIAIKPGTEPNLELGTRNLEPAAGLN